MNQTVAYKTVIADTMTTETLEIYGAFDIASTLVQQPFLFSEKASDIAQVEPVYTIDDIKNDRFRIIEGYANTVSIDRVNDRVDPKAFKKSLTTYLDNPVLRYNHQTGDVVGKVLEAEIHAGKGLWIRAQIGSGTKADEIWLKIRNRELRGFSVYGIIKEKSLEQTLDGKRIQNVKEFDLHEIAVVDIPANQESLFEIVKKSVETKKMNENDNNQTPQNEVGNEAINSEITILKRLTEIASFQQKQLEVLITFAETQNQIVEKLANMDATQKANMNAGDVGGYEDDFEEEEDFGAEQKSLEIDDKKVEEIVTRKLMVLTQEKDAKIKELEDRFEKLVSEKKTETPIKDIVVEEAVQKAVKSAPPTEEEEETEKSFEAEDRLYNYLQAKIIG